MIRMRNAELGMRNAGPGVPYGIDALRRFALLLVACLVATSAHAQQKPPHVGYLFPAGGQRGSTFEITMGGQYLKGATNVIVSGSGVDVTVLQYVKALSKKELGDLRKEMRETQTARKKQKAEADKQKKGKVKGNGGGQAKAPKMEVMADMDPDDWPMDPRDLDVSKMSRADMKALEAVLFNPKKQPNAQLDDRVRISVSIAKDARPGTRELRLQTRLGLSNPVNLAIDSFDEVFESEPNEEDGSPVASLPAVLNGQIMPGDVDKFRFHAKRGQRLVANVQARALIPYLADAVPGWFQAVLALYDSEGTELAFVDDFRFDPDPILRFDVPADGDYELLIRDSIYRGREDFVYRIAIGELPLVERVFPLGGQVDETTRVSLKGWNLPTRSVTVDGNAFGTGVHQVAPLMFEGARPVVFALDTLDERRDREPNNLLQSAQPITLPLTINGDISRPGDWDVYRFQGKKGQTVSAEVFARRLQSPLDSILKLTDAAGKELAVNDDEKDLASGLTTHHADSRLLATLPADGTYSLQVGDAQGAGSDAHAYRLRVAEAQPDFELRVMPSCLNMYAGDTVKLEVAAIRRDGFAGDIHLELVNAPPGFVLGGAWIPASRDRLTLTLSAPREMPEEPLALHIDGVASVGGRKIRHKAVPAEDMMQAFLWRHLVPTEELIVYRVPRKWARMPMKPLEKPVEILPGESHVMTFTTTHKRIEKDLELELSDAPEGVTLGRVTPVAGGVEVTLMGDPEKLVAGRKGNLILSAFVNRAVMGKDKKPTGKRRRIPFGMLPAVPYVVAGG